MYEVNLSIDADAVDDYVEWLLPHMREMLAIDGFVSAQLAEVEACPPAAGEDAAPPQRKQMTATYVLESRAKLQAYFDVHAARLRGDATNRWVQRCPLSASASASESSI